MSHQKTIAATEVCPGIHNITFSSVLERCECDSRGGLKENASGMSSNRSLSLLVETAESESDIGFESISAKLNLPVVGDG